METPDKKGNRSMPIKLWLAFGTFIILFSAVFLLPPIYLALTGSGTVSTYIGQYFIPFMMVILLIFIVLVVVYIYWHMSNQTDLVEKLNRIEELLEERSDQKKTELTSNRDPESKMLDQHQESDRARGLYTDDPKTPGYPVNGSQMIFQPAVDHIMYERSGDVEEPDAGGSPGPSRKFNRNQVKYLIDVGLAVTFLMSFITGLIKFPLILRILNVNQSNLPMYELSIIHDYGSLAMGLLIGAHLVYNYKWILKMTRKSFSGINKKKLATRTTVVSVAVILVIFTFNDPTIKNFIFGPENTIMIEGVGEFQYDPDEIESVRPDIFKPGHFSIFDVLVYLSLKGEIDLEYHFDESMNTHVIDELEGKRNWWYMAYYDAGWPETNVFRMDHYPYKEQMYMRMIKEDRSFIGSVHDTFREEVTRKNANGGEVILPRVTISGESTSLSFIDVSVTAHNLRHDMFQDGVITAIDVIMSMGDQDLITYELEYYETIGFAEVKNYFVQEINDEKGHGRCGFVYEEGSDKYKGFRGNHIHIPSDIRVINSPDYEEWFWICL
jgi:uncharacterized membrane protein